MKKILTFFLALLLAVSICLPVFAEEIKIEKEWSTHLGKVTVTKTEENGETVYAMKNFTASFTTAGVNIIDTLKEIIKDKNSVTLRFSAELKADAEEDFTLGMLIRLDGVHPKIKLKTDFKDIYPGDAVNVIDDGNYLIRIVRGAEVSEDWEVVEGEITLTPDDIVAGFWEKMVLCFDGMLMYEVIDTLYVKNALIEVVDYEDGTGKPTIDIETLNTEKPTIALEDNETPALPEGNHLKDNAWYKVKLGNVIPVENAPEGVYAFSNIGSSYASPAINIYPTIKEMLGDKDEINVWIVFDVRASLTEANKTFGMKLRPDVPKEYTEDKTLFLSEYSGSTFNFTEYGILVSPYSNGEFTNKWQRIEIFRTFTKEDINDKLWTEWNLCFDMMNEYYDIKEIQLKNTAIYFENEYEPVNEVENKADTENTENTKNTENTENPVLQKPQSITETPVVYRPYGFDRYTATFADVVEKELPEGIEETVPEENNNGTLIAVGVCAAAVIIAAVAVTIKVKSKKGENK